MEAAEDLLAADESEVIIGVEPPELDERLVERMEEAQAKMEEEIDELQARMKKEEAAGRKLDMVLLRHYEDKEGIDRG